MKRRCAIVAGLVVLCGALYSGTSADAHAWTSFYNTKWKAANGGDLTLEWRFISNVPAGGFRDRVKQGATQWNAQNQPLQFVFQTGTDYGDWTNSCAQPAWKNGVRYAFIDGDSVNIGAGGTSGGDTLAYEDGCNVSFDNGATWQARNFLITFDSGENWNTTTGDSVDPGIFNVCWTQCQADLWGIAAHEFGHATGWGNGAPYGHYVDTDPACDPPDQLTYHTMCAYYHAGSDRERTLELHDYHTFNTAY